MFSFSNFDCYDLKFFIGLIMDNWTNDMLKDSCNEGIVSVSF